MAKLDLFKIHAAMNVADLLDEEQLSYIGSYVCEGFRRDDASRSEFKQRTEEAMKIAKQIMEPKTEPWPNAANVKYPLLTTAILQSAARQYAEVIRNDKVVQCVVLGSDPDGSKAARASRITDHMSAQLLVEDPEWESDMYKTLVCYALFGTVFKKTFWDELEKRNRSILCAPNDIVVNNNIKSLETARRITHVLYYTKNDLVSRVRYGIFSENVLEDINEDDDYQENKKQGKDDYCDNDQDEFKYYEQHCYLDLDEDGYEEPYIVTVSAETERVARIYNAFDLQNVYKNPNGDIYKIDRVEYFTDYHYWPNPDGGFYSMGNGQLLLPINSVINTTINQMLDAGTASNQQSGFLGRGFKTKSGSLFISPGEWKKVDVAGEDIAKNVYPLPVREPSAVSFNLLNTMIQGGKEVASITDALMGQEQAQNVPATTMLALIQQGSVPHNAIQKRLHLSLRKEFAKWYRLNSIYLNDTHEYKRVLRTLIISKEDYNDQSLDVMPVSDPAMSSDAHRLARARALLEITPMVPQAGAQEILRNWLDALQTPQNQIEKILPPPDPNAPPSPQQMQAMLEQQDMQNKKAELLMSHELKALELHQREPLIQAQAELTKAQAAESIARISKMQSDASLKRDELNMDDKHAHIDYSIKAIHKIDDLAEEHQRQLKQQAQIQAQQQEQGAQQNVAGQQ